VNGNEGARLENIFAVSLLKHVRFVNDTTARGLSLAYLRNKDGREVDFVLAEGDKVQELIEVKVADANPSSGLKYFRDRFFPATRCGQAVMRLRREQNLTGIEIREAASYLSELAA
jgi:predicted AAA+ superfamily ATPase